MKYIYTSIFIYTHIVPTFLAFTSGGPSSGLYIHINMNILQFSFITSRKFHSLSFLAFTLGGPCSGIYIYVNINTLQ